MSVYVRYTVNRFGIDLDHLSEFSIHLYGGVLILMRNLAAVAGYVPHKLLKKHNKSYSVKSANFAECMPHQNSS